MLCFHLRFCQRLSDFKNQLLNIKNHFLQLHCATEYPLTQKPCSVYSGTEQMVLLRYRSRCSKVKRYLESQRASIPDCKEKLSKYNNYFSKSKYFSMELADIWMGFTRMCHLCACTLSCIYRMFEHSVLLLNIAANL